MAALQSSESRDVLYRQAVNFRATGRIAEAIMVLDRLEQLSPGFSRLYQERGYCLGVLREIPKAIEALLHAVSLNSTLPDSWFMLQQLYRAAGDEKSAATAASRLTALRQLPAEVVEATSLFADGDLMLAEEVILLYLRKDGANVGALRLLARIDLERNQLSQAQQVLERVLQQAPDFHAARLDYSMVLLQQQQHQQARAQAELLLAVEPDNRQYLKQYGAACIGLGDQEPVIDLYQRLLSQPPYSGAEVADLRLWRANALKTAGRVQEAVADFHAALAALPDSGVAWFGLSNLKTYRFTPDEIARMQAAESQPGLQDLDRCYLCFALGKALEDREDYEQSWRYYERGNALKRTGFPYHPERSTALVRKSTQVFTRSFFAARTGMGDPDPAPIFIVGLPRSGSTLIEQILASHSQVEGTRELIEIDRYATELAGPDPERPLYPQALTELSPDAARRLGARFLAETRVHRRLGRAFFIDKMPNNFAHIGLIHLMLPNARIIDARREPMACCFGNLKQLFSSGQEFSYGIGSVAHYYRLYLELMRHWNAVLPGRILTVQHEDVVDDLEGSVRRILEFCGLGFEPACLEFHNTRRSIRTVSSEQVREPINRKGIDQWRHYEAWLGPLKEALGDAPVTYRQ